MTARISRGRMFSGWFGFWIFLAVYVVCETFLYYRGHETFFFSHRTEEEKALQRQILEHNELENIKLGEQVEQKTSI